LRSACEWGKELSTPVEQKDNVNQKARRTRQSLRDLTRVVSLEGERGSSEKVGIRDIGKTDKGDKGRIIDFSSRMGTSPSGAALKRTKGKGGGKKKRLCHPTRETFGGGGKKKTSLAYDRVRDVMGPDGCTRRKGREEKGKNAVEKKEEKGPAEKRGGAARRAAKTCGHGLRRVKPAKPESPGEVGCFERRTSEKRKKGN